MFDVKSDPFDIEEEVAGVQLAIETLVEKIEYASSIYASLQGRPHDGCQKFVAHCNSFSEILSLLEQMLG